MCKIIIKTSIGIYRTEPKRNNIPYCTPSDIKSHMDLCDHRAPYGTMPDCRGQYRTIQGKTNSKDHAGSYGTIRDDIDNTGPYRTLLNHRTILDHTISPTVSEFMNVNFIELQPQLKIHFQLYFAAGRINLDFVVAMNIG